MTLLILSKVYFRFTYELGKKIGITQNERINKIEFEEFKQFVEGALLIEERVSK